MDPATMAAIAQIFRGSGGGTPAPGGKEKEVPPGGGKGGLGGAAAKGGKAVNDQASDLFAAQQQGAEVRPMQQTTPAQPPQAPMGGGNPLLDLIGMLLGGTQ